MWPLATSICSQKKTNVAAELLEFLSDVRVSNLDPESGYPEV
jgi:hypothetical protein